MADIFVSYSSADRAEALELIGYLQGEGLSIWIDQTGIDGAQNWSNEIVAAIESCKVFLALLSPNSVSSTNCTRELSLASEKQKQILPVDLGEVTLPGTFQYYLAGLHRIRHSDHSAIRKAFVRLGFLEPRSTPDEAGEHELVNRVAVLPFEDQSPGRDNGWFADGLTDQLISRLQKLDRVFIVDSQTVREYRDTKLRAKQIAHELDVRYLLRGAVRKIDTHIQVQATFIDAQNGGTVWDQSFAGTMNDIFQIQEQATTGIAKGLKLRLSPEERRVVSEMVTNDPNAYELFLQGLSHQDRGTKQDLHHAITFYESAISRDPQFAHAYANLSRCETELYRLYDRKPEMLERAERAADRALAISPSLPDGFRARAKTLLSRKHPHQALEAAKQAVALAPGEHWSYTLLGNVYEELGDFQSAAESYEVSLLQKPDALATYYNLSLQYDRLHNLELRNRTAGRAIPLFEKYLLRHPDDETHRMWYAFFLEYLGRTDESTAEIERLIAMPTVDSATLYNAACALIVLGNHALGAKVLERAVASGFSNIDLLLSDSDLDPIRDSPSFASLLRRLDPSATNLTETFPEANRSPSRRKKRAAIAALVAIAVVLGSVYLLSSRSSLTTKNAERRRVLVFPLLSENSSVPGSGVATTLTDSIINLLSRQNYLELVPMATAAKYSGAETNKLSLCKELGVRFMITGDATKVGDSVVAAIHIYDTRIDLDLADVVYPRVHDRESSSLAQEISGDIAEVLCPHSLLESGLATEEGTQRPEVFAAIVHARKSANDLQVARTFYDQAVALDPGCAEVWAERAQFFSSRAFDVDSMQEWAAIADVSATTAVKLAPDKYQGHLAKAMALWLRGQVAGAPQASINAAAITEARRALEIEPNNPIILTQLATLLAYNGEHSLEEARKCIRHALLIDQGNVRVYERYAMSFGPQSKTIVAEAKPIYERLARIYPNNLILGLKCISTFAQISDSAFVLPILDSLLREYGDHASNSLYQVAWSVFLRFQKWKQGLDMLDILRRRLRQESWTDYKQSCAGELCGFLRSPEPGVVARFKAMTQ